MSRKEFLDELAFLLQDIPLVEQLEALQYYNDYFDDAGPEAEQDIIKELERDVYKRQISARWKYRWCWNCCGSSTIPCRISLWPRC